MLKFLCPPVFKVPVETITLNCTVHIETYRDTTCASIERPLCQR